MSKIRVWTPQGDWSEEVIGLDKVNLMKEAISDVYYENLKYNRGELEGYMENIEIDCRDCVWSTYERHSDKTLYWYDKEHRIKEAKSFKMPLHTLESMIKKATYLSDVYQKLKDLAEIPAGTAVDNYWLLFKFEDE